MFLQDHRQLFLLALLVEGQAEQRLGIDGQVRAVAIEEVAHLVVVDFAIDQHHVDEGVEIVGLGLVRLLGLRLH